MTQYKTEKMPKEQRQEAKQIMDFVSSKKGVVIQPTTYKGIEGYNVSGKTRGTPITEVSAFFNGDKLYVFMNNQIWDNSLSLVFYHFIRTLYKEQEQRKKLDIAKTELEDTQDYIKNILKKQIRQYIK